MLAISPNDVLPHSAGNPDSLFSQVADHIALAIVSGQVPAGELIPNETTIGGNLSVSRSVYREAVKFLSGKGLFEARPKSGTRAAPSTHWNLLDPDVLRWSFATGANEKFIHDLYELRVFVEPNVARFAAQRRTDEQAQQLRRSYEGMAATEPCSAANIRHDLDFHETLIDSCGNYALMCLKGVVTTTLMWALRMQTGKTMAEYATSLADHRRLCEAIENRDSERAQAVMSVIVHHALLETLTIYRERRSRPSLRTAAE